MTDGTSRAFPGWEEVLPYVLWRAQQAVHRRLQEDLNGLGVTVTQLGLGVHLQEYGMLSASDLSRGFHITPQSTTTALNRLESLGWVTRRPHPVHKRVVWYELTPPGLAGVQEGRARVAAVAAAISAVLGDGEAAMLDGLHRIVAAIDGDEGPFEPMWPSTEPRRDEPRGSGGRPEEKTRPGRRNPAP